MARPPDAQDSIDSKELNAMLEVWSSVSEVADRFDVSVSSIKRYCKKNFKCSFDRLRAKRFIRTKTAIKRMQIKKALDGDNTMLIWCGKQYLGQTEKVEQKQDTQITGDIVYTTSWGNTNEPTDDKS
jgi:hypothetical protein